MRRVLVYGWLVVLICGILSIFWYNEWVFNLPTPVPANYTIIPVGSNINLPRLAGEGNNKPVFLHFFNPDCPCSRFNIEHVRSLVKEYGSDVNFAVVLVSNKNYTEKEIQERFNLRVPVVHDTSLAALCGVYSTPQAVILDARHKLYYRGNYNRNRYCADKKTNFAEAALEALLHNNYAFVFDAAAVKAYGCQLPGCRK